MFRFFRVFSPRAAVFLAGFCVMVLEFAAGRMIARHIGSSLYVWTSVVGVVLLGGALGSAVGGRFSDRFRPERLIPLLFLAGTLTSLAVPVWDVLFFLMPFSLPVSWPVQVGVQVLAVFFLPSFFLGMITPVAARMALSEGRGTGRIMGSVGMWEACGCILGVFLSGYGLISLVGALRLILLLAVILSASALFIGAPSRLIRTVAGVLTILVILVMVIPGWSSAWSLLPRRLAVPGETILFETDSRFSWLTVRKTSSGELRLHEDALLHSAAREGDPRLLYVYHQIQAALLRRAIPSVQNPDVAVIGGGAYVFPLYLRSVYPGGTVDVVEIDPAVTDIARKWFGLGEDARLRIHHQDARITISEALRRGGPHRWDAVIQDAFNHYMIPFQLVSKEYLEQIHALLKPEGVFVINAVDSLGEGLFLGSFLNTLVA